MPISGPPSDPEGEALWESIVEQEVIDLQVKTLNISTGGKVSVKDHNGTIRSFDSQVSWTLVAPEGKTMSLEAARRAGFRYMPRLVEKVCTDLYIAGVMDEKEAVMRIREAQARYQGYSGGRKQDLGNLRDDGTGAGAAATGSTGAAGTLGEAAGGAAVAGHGDQPVDGGHASGSGREEVRPSVPSAHGTYFGS
jgi:hypothetical protein